MSQNVYPTSDVTNNWTAGGYADIDDGASPPSPDSDFAYTQDNPAAGSTGLFEVAIGDPADPVSSADHVVRWRHVLIDGGAVAGSAGSGCDITVSLYKGGTLIADSGLLALDAVLSWTEAEFTLSGAEADAIGTDYSDLRIRWDAQGGGSSPANRRAAGVSWAELEVPSVASARRVFIS
jgi:hypothetical protein